MGCGSSKGVAPAPAAAVSINTDQQAQGAAPASDVAAVHKQRLEQQHSQNSKAQPQQQHGDLCLPGRIESTTTSAPPPLLQELPEVVDLPSRCKDPAKAAEDSEFDYGKELQRGEALGSAGAAPVSSAQGPVVGGLLSQKPDWLRGSSSDPITGAGKLPGLTPAQGPPAGKTVSSLPPLVGRGTGAPAAGSSSLPPLFARGSRSFMPVGFEPKDHGAASGNPDGPNTRVSGSDTDVAKEVQQASLHKEASSNSSSSSSASSSRSGSPDAAAALPAPASAAIAAASSHGHADSAADPWNSLQSQYAHAQGSPSPDSSLAGGSPAAAAAPAGRGAAGASAASPPPLHGSAVAAAAGAAAGSRRGTGSQQPEPKRELVLVDSDEESPAPKQQQQQKGENVLAAAKTNRSSFSSSGGKISAQSSQRSVSSGAPHVAKSGGWGVGSLAGAGTIMLGNEPSSRKPGLPSAAAGVDDDVFGDDEAPVLPRGFSANGLAAEASSNLRSSRSRVRVGGGQAAQLETLDVEEIEDDVDALIESEMARDGLPADLATKLAQFEAMGAESDEGEASGAESPSIYAMMNNRQGSWRAA